MENAIDKIRTTHNKSAVTKSQENSEKLCRLVLDIETKTQRPWGVLKSLKENLEKPRRLHYNVWGEKTWNFFQTNCDWIFDPVHLRSLPGRLWIKSSKTANLSLPTCKKHLEFLRQECENDISRSSWISGCRSCDNQHMLKDPQKIRQLTQGIWAYQPNTKLFPRKTLVLLWKMTRSISYFLSARPLLIWKETDICLRK